MWGWGWLHMRRADVARVVVCHRYGAPAPPPGETNVVIVFNVPTAMNISGLFNLFGLYGNIMKIKTLPKSVR